MWVDPKLVGCTMVSLHQEFSESVHNCPFYGLKYPDLFLLLVYVFLLLV